MIYYGMVNTSKSSKYTVTALRSFIKNTELAPDDRFFLIDNDNDFDLPPEFNWVHLIRHEKPQGFGQNVNLIIRLAMSEGADVVFPNNDVVFGPGWLEPLMARDDAILIPLCNQFQVYSCDGFALGQFMDVEDYLGHEEQFDAIVRIHQHNMVDGRYLDQLHISFFCFRIPHRVYATIGLFDENFGRGGGEDVDYRIRAHLAGFDVCMAPKSYLLHFMGKSTWRGGESQEESNLRNVSYYNYFCQKWGNDLAQLFLFISDWQGAMDRLGVKGLIDAGQFQSVIQLVLARRY